MLPLEQPAYNPRIFVVGGSINNGANPGTPATPATYLLDFSILPFAWVREDMSSPRVMPDATLLPDGELCFDLKYFVNILHINIAADFFSAQAYLP